MGMIPKALICLVFMGLVSGGDLDVDKTKLIISAIKSPPFLMESHGGEEKFEGFFKDVIDDLSMRLDFDYDLRLVKDGRYGSINSTKKWTGMVGELLNKECDLALGDLTINAERAKVIDFTTPILDTRLVMVHSDRRRVPLEHINLVKNEDFFTLLKPMSPLVWMGFIVVVLLFTGLIMLVETRMVQRTEKEKHGIHITKLRCPKSIGGRFMSIMFLVWLVFLVAIYMSSLTAQRMTKLNMRREAKTNLGRFNTLEELVNDPNMKFGFIANGATASFFKNSKIPFYNKMHRKVMEWQTFANTANDGVMRVLEDRNANFAFVLESTIADYIVRKHCGLYVVPERFGPAKGFGIALQKDNPLLSKMNVEILTLKDEGRIEELYNKWWKSITPCRRMSTWNKMNMDTSTMQNEMMMESMRDNMPKDRMENRSRMDRMVDREINMEECMECRLQVTMREMSCMFLFAACCMIIGVMISVMDFRRTK